MDSAFDFIDPSRWQRRDRNTSGKVEGNAAEARRFINRFPVYNVLPVLDCSFCHRDVPSLSLSLSLSFFLARLFPQERKRGHTNAEAMSCNFFFPFRRFRYSRSLSSALYVTSIQFTATVSASILCSSVWNWLPWIGTIRFDAHPNSFVNLSLDTESNEGREKGEHRKKNDWKLESCSSLAINPRSARGSFRWSELERKRGRQYEPIGRRKIFVFLLISPGRRKSTPADTRFNWESFVHLLDRSPRDYRGEYGVTLAGRCRDLWKGDATFRCWNWE